jgi:hypothetical protein
MEPFKKESMSLNERTQSVSSVPKIPKDLNEFKSRYNELLDYHLTQNEYHNELTFVKEWINTYSNGIDILQKRTNPETLTPIEQRGLEALRAPYGYYDVKFSFGLIYKFLKQRKKEIKAESNIKPKAPQQDEDIMSDNIKVQHPNHDPNLWNNDCFELFKYLFDCYYISTKRQLTNIWFYLKENGNIKYNLKATKDQYVNFISENYQKEITNFDKAQTKWEDKEYQTIYDHRKNFEDTLKQIVENAKNT